VPAPPQAAKTRIGSITGLGAVSPVGLGAPDFIRALRAGRSGVRPLSFTHPSVQSSVAAECLHFQPRDALDDPAELRRLPRLVPMALAAAREAARHARLPLAPDAPPQLGRRVGVILGTGGGGIDFTIDQARSTARGGRASLWTITNATHGNLAGEISIGLGARGPSLCVSTGCASSSDALGLALDLLRSDRPGTPDAWVVVGADAHVQWEVLHSMELLRVISTRSCQGDPDRAAAASRPFDASRDGFVLGEGAWALVLERPDFSKAREAEPLGALLGYGATCDAHHRVRPAADMAECARAINLAVEDADLQPTHIQVVQYHGTGTALNDTLETRAVRIAFGDHADRLQGSSIKSMIGHPQGACGLAALVATVGALTSLDDHQAGAFIPPTINLTRPDPECDLDYTPQKARPTSATTALVNCLAFGAKNSALVLRAARPE